MPLERPDALWRAPQARESLLGDRREPLGDREVRGELRRQTKSRPGAGGTAGRAAEADARAAPRRPKSAHAHTDQRRGRRGGPAPTEGAEAPAGGVQGASAASRQSTDHLRRRGATNAGGESGRPRCTSASRRVEGAVGGTGRKNRRTGTLVRGDATPLLPPTMPLSQGTWGTAARWRRWHGVLRLVARRRLTIGGGLASHGQWRPSLSLLVTPRHIGDSRGPASWG